MKLTRRDALAGAAGLAAAPLLPAVPARAAAPVAGKQNASFYRYKVGDAEVTVVSDGSLTVPLPDGLVDVGVSQPLPLPLSCWEEENIINAFHYKFKQFPSLCATAHVRP